ncbi:MAG: hypothetical protein E7340_04250 [Clostridiales bacterium]|nr:hypothetical protein [Clostridiales bacterium]
MDILQKIERYYNSFNGEKGIIGFSEKSQPIYYFCVAKSFYPKIIVQCGMHAREHITSHLCLKLIDYFSKFSKVGTVYFIPAVNPDGIKIAINTLPLYKANANGVDLNVNFDAKWGNGAKNTTKKGAENYIGRVPFSESETIALAAFTLLIYPHLTVSFHSKGEEIYYEFNQNLADKERDYSIAKTVQNQNGYAIKATPLSSGGYKDWCIQNLKIPALTIEVGADNLSHPIGVKHLGAIFNKNKNLLSAVIHRLMELKWT